MRKQCAAFLLAPHDLLISQFSLGLLLIVLIALADCIGPTVSFAQLRRPPHAGRAQYVRRRFRLNKAEGPSPSDPHAKGKGRVPLPFLGWNYGQRAGAAYVQRFARRRRGLAIPVRNASSPSTLPSFQRPSPLAISLTSPATLPGFLFRPTLPAGFIPASVTTGDFNSDGRLDWVVANGGDNNLWLYLGNGDGTSQLPTIIPLGGAPIEVLAADLRGSGTLDLIVAEPDSNTVGVLLSDGHGGFSAEVQLPLPAPPLSLAVQDFNGDGHLDIVAGLNGTQQTGALAYLQGNGDGTFGTPVTSEGPPLGVYSTIEELAAADLNGDKLPDVVAYDIGSLGGNWVYLNHGDGTFGPPQPGPTPNGPDLVATNFALADLNRDGCVDMVVLDTWDLAERYFGNCDGTFQMSTSSFKAFGVGDIGYGIGLADVNGDGNLDIVSSGIFVSFLLAYGWQSGHLVSVLPGDGQGGFGPPTVYRGDPGMYSLAIADLKGDGFPDIITANQDADSVSVYANDGKGGFGPPQGGYIGYYVNGVSTGVVNAPLTLPIAKDVNGDGNPDLSLIEGTSPGDSCGTCDNLGVLLNLGNGTFSQVTHSDLAGTISYNIGDFALNSFRNTTLPDLSLVGSQYSMGTPLLLFAPNNGNGTFGAATSSSPPGADGLLGVGDFNGDGNLDSVAVHSVPGSAANSNSSELTVFLGDGAGGFTPGYQARFNVNSSLYPGRTFVGDFNGDGKPDVLVQENSTLVGTLGHDVYEFLGNGDGTFALPKIVLTNAGPITVADLNHDGRPDITELVVPLTTLAVGTKLQFNIYLCQPDGSFTVGNTYEPYSGKIEIGNEDYNNGPFLADFNGDGNLDVAVFQSPPNGNANFEDNTYFQILSGNGDGTFTPTYTVFDITTPRSPQVAADVTGNGRADLVELDDVTSSYNVIPAVPGPALQIRMVSDPVIGSDGIVQINLAVPSSSSTTINLSTSDPAITIPTSVTIPAGSVSQDIPFQIGSTFNASHVFSIQAQLGTETETVYGTQATHVEGFTMYLAFTSYTVAGGQTTPDYVLNTYSVGGYSTTVQVQCMGLPVGASCLFGDMPLTISGNGGAITSLVVETTSSVPAGTYPFTVMATDGTISRQVTATLVVIQAPALQLSPAVLTFPMQAVGTTSSPQIVTITNSGGAAMTLSVSIDGAITPDPNFAMTNNCGSSLDAGQSCTATVNFTPTITGSMSGSIYVDANISGATRQYVNLTGTAEGALMKLSTSSLNFNIPIYVGQTSAAQTVTVWNTGTVPINFSGISTTGANATDFVASAESNCSAGGQLKVGFGCAISVTFAPSASGTRTATLSVADDVSGSPQTVSLSGSANPPDFTIGPTPGSPSSATVTAGGSATYSVTLAPLGTFNQAVTVSCPGAPSGGKCSVSPTSVTLNGSGAQNVTVTVTTRARSLVMRRGPAPPALPPMAWWIALIALVTLNLLVGCAARRGSFARTRLPGSVRTVARAFPRRAVWLGSILLAVTFWASCGGGGGSAVQSSPGTPTGSYAMSVTGTSGNLSHTTIITLTVK